jgi:hypothetical protein
MTKKKVEKNKKQKKERLASIPAAHKGQAMMEYLMTYGVALVVILIVLAVLVTVVLPTLKPPENCQFSQPGLSCNVKKHAILADSTTGNLKLVFQLDNQQNGLIRVVGIRCSNAPAANVQKAQVVPRIAAISIPQGASRTLGVTGSAAQTVNCYDERTGTVMQSAPNSEFKGSLAIVYTSDGDAAGIEKLAVATLSGVVQAQ